MTEHTIELDPDREDILQWVIKQEQAKTARSDLEAVEILTKVIVNWLDQKGQDKLQFEQQQAFQAYQAADPTVQMQVRVLLGLAAPPESQKKNFQGV